MASLSSVCMSVSSRAGGRAGGIKQHTYGALPVVLVVRAGEGLPNKDAGKVLWATSPGERHELSIHGDFPTRNNPRRKGWGALLFYPFRELSAQLSL